MGVQKKRISYIDVAKGIGMFCIVFGHVMKSGYLRQMMFAFHVPFFFLLSGMTYRFKKEKKKFYFDKVKRLLIPYFSFSLFSIALYVIMIRFGILDGDGRLIPNLLGMLYANSNTGYMEWNKPLWFLPCLFVAYGIIDVVEIMILKNEKRQLWRRIIAMVAFWGLGILINTIGQVYLPLHLESAVYLCGFFELGIIVQSYGLVQIEEKLRNTPIAYSICILLFCILLGCGIGLVNGVCEVRGHKFGMHPGLFLSSALIFSTAFVIISVWLKNCNALRIIGTESLSIMLLHKFPVVFFQKIPPFSRLIYKGDSIFGLIGGIVLTVGVIVLCIVGTHIIECIAPFLLGKERKNQLITKK